LLDVRHKISLFNKTKIRVGIFFLFFRQEMYIKEGAKENFKKPFPTLICFAKFFAGKIMVGYPLSLISK
jgi:hypothetical protein